MENINISELTDWINQNLDYDGIQEYVKEETMKELVTLIIDEYKKQGAEKRTNSLTDLHTKSQKP